MVRRIWRQHERTPVGNLTVQGLHPRAVGQTQVVVHNSLGMANVPPNSGQPFPANARPGQILGNIDPNTLQAGRVDLEAGRLAQQQQLIQQGITRNTPIEVTPGGVIWDGNHAARAAAQAGVPVTVKVIIPPGPLPPGGPVTKLPVR